MRTDTPGNNSGTLTRRQAAALLGMSVSTLRRLEGKELHPAKGPGGTVLYDRAEVEVLAAARPERLRALPAPAEDVAAPVLVPTPADGDVAALMFTDFNAGKSPTQVVIERHVAPATVRALHADWAAMSGALLVPAPVRAQMERLLQETVTAEVLAKAVAMLCEFKCPCCLCGKPVQVKPGVWKKLVERGYLKGWGHTECVAKK